MLRIIFWTSAVLIAFGLVVPGESISGIEPLSATKPMLKPSQDRKTIDEEYGIFDLKFGTNTDGITNLREIESAPDQSLSVKVYRYNKDDLKLFGVRLPVNFLKITFDNQKLVEIEILFYQKLPDTTDSNDGKDASQIIFDGFNKSFSIPDKQIAKRYKTLVEGNFYRSWQKGTKVVFSQFRYVLRSADGTTIVRYSARLTEKSYFEKSNEENKAKADLDKNRAKDAAEFWKQIEEEGLAK